MLLHFASRLTNLSANGPLPKGVSISWNSNLTSRALFQSCQKYKNNLNSETNKHIHLWLIFIAVWRIHDFSFPLYSLGIAEEHHPTTQSWPEIKITPDHAFRHRQIVPPASLREAKITTLFQFLTLQRGTVPKQAASKLTPFWLNEHRGPFLTEHFVLLIDYFFSQSDDSLIRPECEVWGCCRGSRSQRWDCWSWCPRYMVLHHTVSQTTQKHSYMYWHSFLACWFLLMSVHRFVFCCLLFV